MQTILAFLFIGSALAVTLAMTNSFENIAKEMLTESAEVRTTRENIKFSGCGCNGAPLETREYHIIFFPSIGKNLKCRVPKRMLSDFKVGMSGQLTHKGTWFKSFTNESPEVVSGK